MTFDLFRCDSAGTWLQLFVTHDFTNQFQEAQGKSRNTKLSFPPSETPPGFFSTRSVEVKGHRLCSCERWVQRWATWAFGCIAAGSLDFSPAQRRRHVNKPAGELHRLQSHDFHTETHRTSQNDPDSEPNRSQIPTRTAPLRTRKVWKTNTQRAGGFGSIRTGEPAAGNPFAALTSCPTGFSKRLGSLSQTETLGGNEICSFNCQQTQPSFSALSVLTELNLQDSTQNKQKSQRNQKIQWINGDSKVENLLGKIYFWNFPRKILRRENLWIFSCKFFTFQSNFCFWQKNLLLFI